MDLNDISKPVEKHVKEFKKYFKNLIMTDVSLLNLIIRYLTQKSGKQVRPLLVFLSAELCGGINPRTFVGAGMVELLHTATLIHDDVVDESSQRRGIATINAEWNNKIAVLVGDFLLARGLLSSVNATETEFLQRTSYAVQRMSEGELLAIEKSQSLNVTEEDYFKIIADKTASLISAACEVGAISATERNDMQKIMAKFGEYVGIAFQIRDDVFDLTATTFAIGKPVGNDLKEKKITLPLIHALSKAEKKEVNEVKSKIKSGKLENSDIKKIIGFIKEYGGIDYATQVAVDYSNRAIALLDTFEDVDAKKSLVGFAKFVVERNL